MRGDQKFRKHCYDKIASLKEYRHSAEQAATEHRHYLENTFLNPNQSSFTWSRIYSVGNRFVSKKILYCCVGKKTSY